jgi:hypothetical protein
MLIERLEAENAELREMLEYVRLVNQKQRALIARIRRANNERVLVH